MWKKWFAKSKEVTVDNRQKINPEKLPKHVAIIMDGNGRWAQRKGLPRTFGHRAGVEALRGIVKAAINIKVSVLTVYAFSTENWKRPVSEVDLLMQLFSEYLDNEIDELDAQGVQIRFIGDTSVLSRSLQDKVSIASERTKKNVKLILNVAVNYGGRAEVLNAVQKLAQHVLDGKLDIDNITEQSITERLYTSDLPDPDLVIRTSGDFRLSNFLIWQSAYAELWFTNLNWPDFKEEQLIQAIIDYQKRDRRFGGLKNPK
ncbi:MAG: Undecaprenyl pyrophosphate synthase [Firmicutes bacterium]|nr:Undecaprenyl pyrophosphate synthase [Bacillota bacterium]